MDYAVETVVEGVEVPWALAWTSPTRLLFTERPGRVRVVEDGKLLAEPLYTVPDIVQRRAGEIGLMGITVHPDYAKNKFVYIAYGSSEKDVRVVRLVDTGSTLSEPTVILKGIPAASNHAGCCLAFGPDGKLYVTAGDSTNRTLAPDLSSLAGKILRLNDDGSVPADNPFVGKQNARSEIWTYGHRNPQGLAWQPGTGVLFESEHGPTGDGFPQGDDEFNIIEKGHNYGWPSIVATQARDGMDPPKLLWHTSIAPASAAYYDATLLPQWKGRVLVGALGGLRASPDPGVYVIEVKDGKVIAQARAATSYGRIRAVAVGPEGAVYFTTSNRDGRGRKNEKDDRIMRIMPVKK